MRPISRTHSIRASCLSSSPFRSGGAEERRPDNTLPPPPLKLKRRPTGNLWKRLLPTFNSAFPISPQRGPPPSFGPIVEGGGEGSSDARKARPMMFAFLLLFLSLACLYLAIVRHCGGGGGAVERQIFGGTILSRDWADRGCCLFPPLQTVKLATGQTLGKNAHFAACA